MRIAVLGAGVIGLTSTWALRRAGHHVVVVDRQSGPGLETSHANGALLTPSMAEPWNGPGALRTLLGSLGRRDAALQLRLRALPSLGAWGLAFLANGRGRRFEASMLANLALARSSLAAMDLIERESGIDYGRRDHGTLRIFRDEAAFEAAQRAAQAKADRGLRWRALRPAGAAAIEPALASIAGELIGAIHYPDDRIGDANRFCTGLAHYLEKAGVEFLYGRPVKELRIDRGRVAGVRLAEGDLTADLYVVALGSFAGPLFRGTGIRLPVRPAKGYSVTIDDREGLPTLSIPIVDDDNHAVITPVSGRVRVAGTAEFCGHDLSFDRRRVANLQRLANGVLPDADLDFSQAQVWCGLRAMSSDGVPIIGRTPLANLLVNIGHGHLGWTMAAGAAQLLSAAITGARQELDPTRYALARFTPSGFLAPCA